MIKCDNLWEVKLLLQEENYIHIPWQELFKIARTGVFSHTHYNDC